MSQGVMSRILFRIQTVIWFGLVVAMLALWLFLWAVSDVDKANANRQKSRQTVRESTLPVYIESYVQMTKEVPPIDFSTVIRDLRNYPPEFKDKQYFEKYAQKWTVQVMNVSKNEIITEYLNGRDDRDKFAYFRYHNANGELRYILTYDSMKNAQEALGVITKVDFGLPKTAKIKAEEISYYLKIMDYYERGGVIDDSDGVPREIKLSLTDRPLSAMPVKLSTGSTSQNQPKQGTENKYQNATPNLPNTPSTGGLFGVPTTSAKSAQNAGANPSATASGTPKPAPATPPKTTNKPTPQETSDNHEIVVDMVTPKPVPAPVVKQPDPEPPSVTYQNNGVVYGEAPKQTARPNTNTSRIPGSE